MQQPSLSILIPTLVSRREARKPLEKKLGALCLQYNGEVEVLWDEDNREHSIGYKRNRLLSKATGLFSAFIDDDDDITQFYIPYTLAAIKSDPDIDCVGIMGEMRNNNRFHRWFKHSIEYNKYFQNKTHYFRPPNHLNPIRTEIARRFKFTDTSFGEDTDWAMQLVEAGVLKKERFITQPVYIYKYLQKKYF